MEIKDFFRCDKCSGTKVFSLGALCLFVLLFFSFQCSAQTLELKFDHITSEDGLSQNTINAIAKDKYGFMWFGTESGVCRYDGYRFWIYRSNSGDNKTINNNKIQNIATDGKGQLWIETFDTDSLCRYNFEADNFDRIASKDVPRSLLSKVAQRHNIVNSKIFFRNYNWQINPRTNILEQIFIPTGNRTSYYANPASRWSLNESYVSRLFLDDQQVLWAGTYSNGVNKADLNTKPFRYFYHDPIDNNSIAENNIGAMAEDRDGNIWIGTRYKGITVIRPGRNSLQLKVGVGSDGLVSNKIRALLCDSKGNMWIGTKSGLDRYERKTGKILHLRDSLLARSAVYCAAEDDYGNIWFATWAGIYKYEYAAQRLIALKLPDLKNLKLKALTFDKYRNLWVGSEGGGISVWRPTDDGLKLIRSFAHSGKNSRSISDNRITVVYRSKKGLIWIGTSGGLNTFDEKNNSFRQIPSGVNGLSDNTIAAITEDESGYLWVSHKRGLSKINTTDFSITNYSLDGLHGNEFSDGAVLSSTKNKKLYFGGNNGYSSFYPDSIKLQKSLPNIILSELQVLNQTVQINRQVNGGIILNKPLYLTTEIELSHSDRSFAIEFAGLHYANVRLNRYAYKLEGFDKDWIFTDASRRLASYSNLSPGEYTFMVKASNSDGVWNPRPRVLKIIILAAPWESTWAYFLYALVISGILIAFYYYSIRYARLKSKMQYETIIHKKDSDLNENKIKFFTNISHEIKTPLTLILAPIEQLMSISSGDKRALKELKVMKANGDRLSRLISQLLDLRRFETGNGNLKIRKENLSLLLETVIHSFSQLIREKDIQLALNVPADLLWNFDFEKMENVMYNLLSNALKFTPQGGEILINAREINENAFRSLVIEVIDDGIGIGKGELDTIFLPFRQGELTAAGGTGLGLAYSKTLIGLHEGSITAESVRNPKKRNCTCFRITLPYLELTDNKIEDRMLPEIPKVNTLLPGTGSDQGNDGPAHDQRLKLLLVEDNSEMRKYLKDFFEFQYEILEARNGTEGLLAANRHNPDLIISDVMMPEMDGFEFAKKIKSDLATSHIPLILLTAKAPVESQIEGIETGADDYIVKPFNLALLSSKARGILLNREKLRLKYKSAVTIKPNDFNPVSPDEKLLKKLLDFVEERISEADLNGGEICDKIGLSRTQLYRKVKSLTGLSITELIREIRLKRAKDLLVNKKFNVNEVSYMVGFSTPNHFRKSFKARFNVSPSEFSKNGELDNDGEINIH